MCLSALYRLCSLEPEITCTNAREIESPRTPESEHGKGLAPS